MLGSGILRGVLIGAILSLLVLLHRASRPHVAFLGRIPRTDRFSDIERHPSNESVPGALLFRVESGIVYFNVEAVRDAVWARVSRIARAGFGSRLRPVGRPASSTWPAPRSLLAWRASSPRAGSRSASSRPARASATLLRLEGLEQLLGPISRRTTLAQAVEDVRSEDVHERVEVDHAAEDDRLKNGVLEELSEDGRHSHPDREVVGARHREPAR